MTTAQLQDITASYYDTAKKLGEAFLADYDAFPVVMQHKKFTEDATSVIAKIVEERPIYVLTDERLFSFLTNSDLVAVSSTETAAAKGYWAAIGGMKMYFCHRFFEGDKTKVLVYRRNRVECVSIVVLFP